MPSNHSNDESQPMSRCECEAEEWADLLPGRKVEQEVLDLLDGI